MDLASANSTQVRPPDEADLGQTLFSSVTLSMSSTGNSQSQPSSFVSSMFCAVKDDPDNLLNSRFDHLDTVVKNEVSRVAQNLPATSWNHQHSTSECSFCDVVKMLTDKP